MTQITTITGLVAALGGARDVAAWAGIEDTAVYNWVSRGEIPQRWLIPLLIEVRRRELRVDPRIFGLSDDDYAVLFRRPGAAVAVAQAT